MGRSYRIAKQIKEQQCDAQVGGGKPPFLTCETAIPEPFKLPSLKGQEGWLAPADMKTLSRLYCIAPSCLCAFVVSRFKGETQRSARVERNRIHARA
jgi:hypothetical protein